MKHKLNRIRPKLNLNRAEPEPNRGDDVASALPHGLAASASQGMCNTAVLTSVNDCSQVLTNVNECSRVSTGATNMSKYQNAKMSKCQDVKMSKYIII